MFLTFVFQTVFVVALIAMSFQLYFSPGHWAFISGVNLIFHEAGHVIFSLFGQFMYVLGGTIGELLIPTVVAGHFFLKRQLFSLGFALWWLSTALLNVGIYAADAKERALPLITGDESTHDWMYLLLETNLIRYDNIIGGIFITASVFVFLGALMVFSKCLRHNHYLWKQTSSANS